MAIRRPSFAFLHSSQKGQPYPHLYLRGLDSNAVYSLHVQEGKLADGTVQRPAGTIGRITESAFRCVATSRQRSSRWNENRAQ